MPSFKPVYAARTFDNFAANSHHSVFDIDGDGRWSDQNHEAALADDHSKLLEATRDELARTRAILNDALHERLPEWLAEVAMRRAELFDHVGRARCYGQNNTTEPCRMGLGHRPDCVLGQLLRIVGGPEETQRQVDAAHDFALFHANLVGRATATALQDHEHQISPVGSSTSRDIYYGVLARGVARADEDD